MMCVTTNSFGLTVPRVQRQFSSCFGAWLCAFTVGCLSTCVLCAGDGQDDLKTSFLNEYAPAAKRLEEFYTHLQMTVTETTPRSGEGDSGSVVTRRFFANGSLLGVRNDSVQGAVSGTTVAGPDLTFHVKLPRPDGKYLADEINSQNYKGFVTRIRLGPKLPFAPFCFYEDTILDFLSEDAVTIEGVDDFRDGNDRRVRVLYRAFYPNVGGKDVEFFGWFLFAPEDDWVLLEFQRGGKSPESPHLHCRVTYGEKSGAIPVPEKVEYWRTEGEEHVVQALFVASDVVLEPADAKQFTLQAFGIPDALGLGEQRRGVSTLTIVVVNVAIVLIVIGVVLKRWASARIREEKG